MIFSTRIQHAARLATIAAASAFVMSAANAKSDSAFMKDAAQAGNAEIEAGKLAQTKAQRSDVKSFADTMITDHTKTASELQQLAASKNVQLPDSPSVAQKAMLKAVDAGDNAKFDDRYVKNFAVKAHQDTVKLFQTAAREAKDPDVKAFAQKTLPALQHHLEMAKTLAMGTKAAGGSAAGSTGGAAAGTTGATGTRH